MNVSTIAGPARGVVRVAATPFEWVARARGWRWVVLVGMECAVALVCGALLWYATGRVGVPEAGEPFDVAAFQTEAVPTEDNAYDDFLRAFKLYQPPRGGDLPRARNPAWQVNPGDPKVSAWLDENRKALALFLKASKYSDMMAPREGLAVRSHALVRFHDGFGVQNLAEMADREAARRAFKGDFEGAWECTLAIFRTARLVSRHGRPADREFAGNMRSLALNRLLLWTENPKVTRAQLRQALKDLYALEALEPDDTYTIKYQHVQLMGTLQNSMNGQRLLGPSFAMSGAATTADKLRSLVDWTLSPLRRRRDGEPERSKRVLNILTAQWLDYFSKPPERRPPPTVRVVVRAPFGAAFAEFFEPGPDAPPAARVLSAQELAQAFHSCYDVKSILTWSWTQLRSARNRERGDHASALRTVAIALYRLDHEGQNPPDDQALVGPYLPSLPDESPVSPGLVDESIPEIRVDD
jgi:hypothetical protein